ncbi:MAG: hypothetical protein ABW252_06500 [Polyangiales bacterium]
MLRRSLFALGLVAVAVPAHAEPAPPVTAPSEPPRAIREPVRLTVGASNELMGVLAPDGSALYFVSDANGTSDVMVQRPVQRAPVPLSRGLGDAIGPELSPDGKRIAYISLERDSTGDVCVRPVEGGSETCLTDGSTAELQVLWWDDASLAVLSRRGLHGDFALVRIPLATKKPETLLARNMVGVARSPDRAWVAYIPVDKTADDIGVTFSQRTGMGIALQKLGQAGTAASYLPKLPGVTGSVSFSAQGDFLYFAQFLNDTNKDATLDGDDNAVIFRVPFRSGDAQPVAPDAEPEQLTSARWDCHYPAPTREVLIASCSHEGSLDVYELPLEGAVPGSWDDARLAAEIASARDAWTRLLLYARRMVIAREPAEREALVTRMMALHLELGEYESTIYDAEKRLSTPEARAWGDMLAELAKHRRADQALVRGETSEQYVESERRRAETLRAPVAGEPARSAQLRTLVVSEIDDDIGDKARALAAFAALDLTTLADPQLAPIAARRAERLYRLRGERNALLDAYFALTNHPALTVAERLEYARRFVDALGRGRDRPARVRALEAVRGRVKEGSELSLVLDVEAALLTLDDARQEEVRKALFTLYTQNKDADRRRALVLDTLRAAATLGNEYLQYQFVTSWASALKREQPERKYAEELYDDIVLDRAYGEGRQGKLGESRGYFYGATVATDSLEAHIGFIEARLAEGNDADKALDEIYEKRRAQKGPDAVDTFVRTYREGRTLPSVRDAERHEEIVARATTALAKVASALPKQPQVHQVWGYVLHQRARRAGSRTAAVDANRQYLLALDLARDDERLRARLLHRLGILQASLGNHALALRYLRQRDELPHIDPREELSVRIGASRSAWHTGDAALARDQALRAAEILAADASLARYEPLVRDRLGMALAATPDAAGARAAYDALTRVASGPDAAPRNRLKAHVGLAASALEAGDARAAEAALDEADRILAAGDPLPAKPEVVWERPLIDAQPYGAVQYRALVAGLRAEAARMRGDDRAALAATEQRAKLLAARLKESKADEDRLELSQTELHLTALHHRLGALPEATRAAERGLALAEAYNRATGGEVNDVEIGLVRAYAELRLFHGVRDDALRRDLRADLKRVYLALCKYRNPRLFAQRFLLETYLAQLALSPSAGR